MGQFYKPCLTGEAASSPEAGRARDISQSRDISNVSRKAHGSSERVRRTLRDIRESEQNMCSCDDDKTIPEVTAESKRCLVVDASPELQAWVDRAYRIMEQVDAFKNTSHVPPGTVVVTVAALWKSIEASFEHPDPDGNRPWSIVTDALPVLSDPDNPSPLPGNANSRLPIWFCAFFGLCPKKK